MTASDDYIVRVSRTQDETYSITAIWGTRQQSTATTEATLINVNGQDLFALCAPELYVQALQQSNALRIVIMLAPEAAHLHTVSWETLHNGTIALGLQHAIVRYTPPQTPRTTTTISTPPLRILLTVNGNDTTAEQTERLLAEITQRTPGIITSVTLRNPTQMRIYSELNDAERRREPYHIWHHIGRLATPLGVLFADGAMLAPQLHKMLSTLAELRAVVFQSVAAPSQRAEWLKTCSQLDVSRVLMFDTNDITLSTYQMIEAFYHNLLTNNVSVGILRARQRVSQISFDDRDWTRAIMMQRTLEDAWFTPQQQDNPLQKQSVGTQRDQVFISYSHKDTDWLKRIEVMLKPLTRNGSLDVWTDQRIEAGDDWRHEIETALKRAKAAVMLVSPDFLASDFVQDVEIPSLLDAAKLEGVAILWVPISDCLYSYTPIARYQAIIDPSSPLDSLTTSDANRAIRKIAETIARKMQNT